MEASSFASPATMASMQADSPVSAYLTTTHLIKTLALPHLNLPSSLSSKIHVNLPRRWNYSNAIYSNFSRTPDMDGRKGIWSIRNDLLVPSSPFFSVEAQGGQGPPSMVLERFQSVISQLFQHVIVMYVSSLRGSVTAGMAIFDTMKHIRPDVSTVCVGVAARQMRCFFTRLNLNGYLAYHTNQSLEKIKQDTDRDFFMSAKEAKEYGLIDGVIMNPLKALQPLPA